VYEYESTVQAFLSLQSGVGANVGETVGFLVDGAFVGALVGETVGFLVEGVFVGALVGETFGFLVEGAFVLSGRLVGAFVGCFDIGFATMFRGGLNFIIRILSVIYLFYISHN
jgi:hypothetical protein